VPHPCRAFTTDANTHKKLLDIHRSINMSVIALQTTEPRAFDIDGVIMRWQSRARTRLTSPEVQFEACAWRSGLCDGSGRPKRAGCLAWTGEEGDGHVVVSFTALRPVPPSQVLVLPRRAPRSPEPHIDAGGNAYWLLPTRYSIKRKS
jgi:hypothetical protein